MILFFLTIFLTVLPHLFLQTNFRIVVKFGNHPFMILVGTVLNLSMYLWEKAAATSILRPCPDSHLHLPLVKQPPSWLWAQWSPSQPLCCCQRGLSK